MAESIDRGGERDLACHAETCPRAAAADVSDDLGTRHADHQRQAQKLEAIGQLAAGIAHEINTPTQYVGDNIRFLDDAFDDLTGVFGALDELRDQWSRGMGAPFPLADAIERLLAEVNRADLPYLQVEIPRAIAQSLEGVERVARIVRAMREFSHPHSAAKVAVDLNRAIETTMIVAQNELKYVADSRLDLDTQLPLVPCLPGEINQVLLNLVVNAAHAVADRDHGTAKGSIVVTTRRVDGWAELQVADSGTGIPEAIRTRIFEPFFTTKEVGRGTGQGLAIAHAVVVTKHGGRIWFDTEIGRGTTFFVRLPLDAEPGAA